MVDVFPMRWDEKVLFSGYHGRVWMRSGVSAEQVLARAAAPYRGAGFDDAGVALLLAAGNVPSLTVTDLLHLLYGRGCVVAVKMNPVLAYLRPALERIFADFVDRGWVRFVDETPEAGAYLVHHPGIDRLHMTGSATTYDALVWGVDEYAEHRRAAGTPLLDKPFTAELGGVAPLIVVPGRLERGRRAPSGRPHRLREAVQLRPHLLRASDPRPAGRLAAGEPCFWTRSAASCAPPNPASRTTRAPRRRSPVRSPTDDYEVLLEPGHRVLVDRLDPATDDAFFRDEVFADVLGVVRLPAPSVDGFLAEATRFANERLAGTLAASVIVDPTAAKKHAYAVDRAVADLRYGAIGVNEWAVMATNFGYTTWGGFPGHTPQAIGSGTGTVMQLLHARRPGEVRHQRPVPAADETAHLHGEPDRWGHPASPHRLPVDRRDQIPAGVMLSALRA